MQPQNAPKQTQKPQNWPHSQVHVNLQPQTMLQKGCTQRHKIHSTLSSLGHCHTVTRPPERHQESELQGRVVRETISHSQGLAGGFSQCHIGTVPSTQATVTQFHVHTARRLGKGRTPATGSQISEPASHTVTQLGVSVAHPVSRKGTPDGGQCLTLTHTHTLSAQSPADGGQPNSFSVVNPRRG